MSKTITIDLKELQNNCPAQQTVPQAVLDRLQEQLLNKISKQKPKMEKETNKHEIYIYRIFIANVVLLIAHLALMLINMF